MREVTATMRSAQYAVSLVRGVDRSNRPIVLEWLVGGRYRDIKDRPAHAPAELVEKSGLQLAAGRDGSSTRVSMGEFFIAVALSKLSTLLPSLPAEEQLLLELVILNGVDGAAWQGASWAAVAYRSRLSSLIRRISLPDYGFTRADVTRLKRRFVMAGFFARAFETVVTEYAATAGNPEVTSFDKVYGYHGAGMSYLGLGEEGVGIEYLRRAADYMAWEANFPYAFSLVSLDRATNMNFLTPAGMDPNPDIEGGMLNTLGNIMSLASTEEGLESYERLNYDFLEDNVHNHAARYCDSPQRVAGEASR